MVLFLFVPEQTLDNLILNTKKKKGPGQGKMVFGPQKKFRQ